MPLPAISFAGVDSDMGFPQDIAAPFPEIGKMPLDAQAVPIPGTKREGQTGALTGATGLYWLTDTTRHASSAL